MSCEGCFTTNKAKNEALTSAKVKAKQRAIEQQTPIAIVFENDQYQLYDAFYAYQNGMAPKIEEVMSHHG